MTIQEKRELRKHKTAECFTPSAWVIKALDCFSDSDWEDATLTFTDPACGNGNILVEILKRKLANRHDPLQALSTVYGCDIMRDNIKECRLRLLKVISHHTKITYEMVETVFNNIVWTPLHQYPNGSLDYLQPDSTTIFRKNAKKENVEKWLHGINKEHWLDKVNEDTGEVGEVGEEETTVEEAQGQLVMEGF